MKRYLSLMANSKNNSFPKDGNKTLKKKPKSPSWFALQAETKRGITVVILFTLALFSILSFVGRGGTLGNYFFGIAKLLFGFGFFIIPLILVGGALLILRRTSEELIKGYRGVFFGCLLFLVSFLGLAEVTLPEERGGGYLGYVVSYPFLSLIGFWGTILFLVALFLIAILIVLNISLERLFSLGLKKKEEEMPEPLEQQSDYSDGKERFSEKKRLTFVSKIRKISARLLGSRRQSPLKAKPEFKISHLKAEPFFNRAKKDEVARKRREVGFPKSKNWRIPSLNLLYTGEEKPSISQGEINSNVNIIKRTLANFGIEVEMGEVNVGPTVTQYTLKPAIGIKLSAITTLHSDLALALARHPLRIEAPIPGKSLVGVEVPNRHPTLVGLKGLLEYLHSLEKRPRLGINLGRDVAGHPIVADLADMPHLMIAGATGSGKSIAINSIIASLLYQKSPDELKFIMVDPKRVELTLYNGLPYLLTPVVVEAQKTVNALKWAIKEMERRYKLLAEIGSRDIESYNKVVSRKIRKKEEDKKKEKLPYIVIIIDELADLIISYRRDVESAIVRLAQMARAVGLHLILATQRPSVEVITGLIKANITSRIAFQVASQVDSRTILDVGGAEKLLGKGDMLFISAKSSKPRRLQGAYIGEKEVKALVAFIKKEGKELDYEDGLIEDSGGGLAPKFVNFEEDFVEDDLYEEARRTVIETGRASASLLQRRFRIGYARAARLLDILEERGVISPPDGSKPRQILVSKKE